MLANLQVTRLILLVPRDRLRSAFVTIPLELTSPEAITVLAGTITMTPGTLSAELSADGRSLLVHGLDVPDPERPRGRDQVALRGAPVGDLPMIHAAVVVGTWAVAAAMLLNLYRLAKGPDVADRILALDTLSVNAVALIVLIDIALGSELYFEAALLIAMIGFVGTVAFCKYVLRGDVIE